MRSDRRKHGTLCPHTIDSCQELCYLLLRVDRLLLLLTLRNGNTLAGVIGEHFHLHSVAEHIADEAEMMNGCLSRQRSAVKCQIVDELLDMMAGDLVKSEVTDRRISMPTT